MTDSIRETITARADYLGLTAYAVAKQCDPPIDPGTIKRYFAGRRTLNSRYVSAICKVLGLELRPCRK